MIEACDPDANIDDLRALIKMNTGQDVKLTKKQICQVYDEIKEDKLPLPPLIMNSTKTYLVDKKSPLKPIDYEVLFDTSSKRSDIKRVARKVGLKQVDQMTKNQMIDSIGKRLRYMKIHEPVKISRRRVKKIKAEPINTFNNTAVNTFNNTVVKNEVNTAVNTFNNTAVKNEVNTAVNTFNNTAVKNEVNTAVNNRFNNTVVTNRFNNTAVKTENTNTLVANRFNNTAVKPPTQQSRVVFPKGSLFTKGQKPSFLGGVPTKKKSFFGGIFGGGKPQNNKKAPNVINNKKAPNVINNRKVPNVVNNNKKAPNVINNRKVPNVPKAPIKPTNINLDTATNRVKKLGLKREKPYIEKLKVNGVKRQDVIDEAVKYRELESNFVTKLSQMTLSNSNRNSIIQRMATDDLKQLEVEAQLKSDEANNVVKTKEQKMNMILATLPFINDASKISFKSRSKAEGVNINSLIEEAKRNNETKRNSFVTNQKQKFMNMIRNVKLSDDDKKSLQTLINDKTNLNSLKNRADKLVEQRKKEKTALIKQNLLTFLTPLKINQTNKNGFLSRFNKGESINVLKREATNKEKEVARGASGNMRTRLVKSLDELELNAQDKNAIMSRFNNGNKNINKLVTEARQLKNRRSQGKIGTEKERLTTLAKQLNVYNNFSNSISKLRLMNAVENLEKRITNAGTEKKGGIFAKKIQSLSNIAREMNLDANIKSNIIKIKTNNDVDAIKVRMIDAGKKKLSEKAQSLNVNYSSNIEKLQNVDRMVQLRNLINQAGAKKKAAKQKKNVELLAERKREVKNYINQNSTLPQNKKNAFIKQLNLNSVNLNALRKEINAEIQRVKNTKRSKNLDELEQYLEPLNINRTVKNSFIQKFKNSNVSLTNIKSAVNKEVAKKGDINSRRRVVMNKIKEATEFGVAFNFNTNMENIDELNRKVDNTIEGVINKTRNTLSNKIINAGVKNDLMNKVTAIKTLKNMKNVERQIENAIKSKTNSKESEIRKYMRRIGLTNENIQSVISRKLSLNDSRELANTILTDKKRLELTKFLDERKVPIVERNQFYNQLKRGDRFGKIKGNVGRHMSKKARERQDIDQVLAAYDLKNEDRKFIIDEWVYYPTMTPEDVKDLADKLSAKFKKEKEMSLRKYVTDELKLSPEDIESIMKNFNINPRNMATLREKAAKIKNVSGQEQRILNRIRKAREENGLNLKFKVNIKSANNVKNLNKKINNAYIGKGKKDLARRALNRDVNISNNLNAVKSMNNVKRLKNKLNGIIGGKKNEDLRKLQNATRDLNRENQERFLKRFKNQNNSLGNLLNNVSNFKNELTKKKQNAKKQELYTYLNEKLNLNVTDRNAIMQEYDLVKNVNKMRRKAEALKKQRSNEKIAENRKQLEKILKGMNLEERDKRFILLRFDRAPGNVNAFEANAKKLVEQKKANKRSKEVSELDTHMRRLGLSDENMQKILNVFKQNPDKTLNSAKTNASTVRRTMNQRKLETAMNAMKNLTENNKAEFRKKLIEPQANLGVVIRNAQARNASMRSKKTTERNVADYIAALGIGETGNKLLDNFRKGTLTANRAKEEADKKKKSLNANVLVEKKKKLRAFMNNTLLTNANKNKFVNRVTLKENITALEKEITTLNTQMKSKKNAFATKQATLKTYLNGLTNLTIEQKTKFMGEVKNATTDIERIKRRAKRIDDSKKKGKKVRNERAKPNEENNFNASKAMNILNKQREGEAKRRERAKPKEENNFNAVAALETLNTGRNVRELKNYVKATSLPENIKKQYLTQLNKPKTNLKAIRGLVNANVRRNTLQKKMKQDILKSVPGFVGQYRRGWERAIDQAKGEQALKALSEDLSKKIKLREEIEQSKIGTLRKRGHLTRLMDVKNDVDMRRRMFEQQLGNLEKNTKKRELSAYIVKLNIPAENKSNYVKQINKPGANLNMIRASANKQVEQKISNVSKSLVAGAIGKIQKKENKNIANASKALVAGAIGKIQKKENKNIANASKSLVAGAISNLKKKNAAARKIQATFRRKKDRNANENNNGEISAAALAPKPSFSAFAQKNTKKVANAVVIFNRRSATSVVNRLKKLTPIEKTQYKGKISRANTKSEIREIQESAVRVDARKKFEENKKKADAESERVRKMKEKKATREAAERAAVSAKKMLTETEKMKAKAKENKKFNNKLAEKRRLLREREAKSQPKKRKPKKK
jgi:hypothetical protein